MKPIQRRLIVYGLAATMAASSIAPAFAFSRKHPMAERPMNPPAPKAKQEQKTDDARNYSGYARYDYLLKQAQLKKQQEEARKQKAAKQQKHAKAPKPAKKQKTSLPAPVAVPIPAPKSQTADVTAVSETAQKEAKTKGASGKVWIWICEMTIGTKEAIAFVIKDAISEFKANAEYKEMQQYNHMVAEREFQQRQKEEAERQLAMVQKKAQRHGAHRQRTQVAHATKPVRRGRTLKQDWQKSWDGSFPDNYDTTRSTFFKICLLPGKFVWGVFATAPIPFGNEIGFVAGLVVQGIVTATVIAIIVSVL